MLQKSFTTPPPCYSSLSSLKGRKYKYTICINSFFRICQNIQRSIYLKSINKLSRNKEDKSIHPLGPTQPSPGLDHDQPCFAGARHRDTWLDENKMAVHPMFFFGLVGVHHQNHQVRVQNDEYLISLPQKFLVSRGLVVIMAKTRPITVNHAIPTNDPIFRFKFASCHGPSRSNHGPSRSVTTHQILTNPPNSRTDHIVAPLC